MFRMVKRSGMDEIVYNGALSDSYFVTPLCNSLLFFLVITVLRNLHSSAVRLFFLKGLSYCPRTVVVYSPVYPVYTRILYTQQTTST